MITAAIHHLLTPLYALGCVFVEQPTMSARCPKCNEFCKTGVTPTGEEVFLRIPYQIRSVNISESRAFEKVSTYFRHDCNQVVAA